MLLQEKLIWSFNQCILMDIWGVNVLCATKLVGLFWRLSLIWNFWVRPSAKAQMVLYSIHSLSPLLCPSWMPYICTTSTNIRLLMPTLPTHPLCPCKSPVLTVCVWVCTVSTVLRVLYRIDWQLRWWVLNQTRSWNKNRKKLLCEIRNVCYFTIFPGCSPNRGTCCIVYLFCFLYAPPFCPFFGC